MVVVLKCHPRGVSAQTGVADAFASVVHFLILLQETATKVRHVKRESISHDAVGVIAVQPHTFHRRVRAPDWVLAFVPFRAAPQ